MFLKSKTFKILSGLFLILFIFILPAILFSLSFLSKPALALITCTSPRVCTPYVEGTTTPANCDASNLCSSSPNSFCCDPAGGGGAAGAGGEVGAGLKEAAGVAGIGKFNIAIKIGDIISLILGFVGVIFLILMIAGGLMWMTASGNEERVTKAKSLITNAVIGMIIVFSAYAITYFVTETLLSTR